MLKVRILIYCISFFVITGCSSLPKTQVLLKSDEALAAGNSFYMYPLQLGKTLANTHSISKEFQQIESQAKKLLALKNYTVGPVKTADGLIRIGIETKSTGAVSDEDLRMMKGARSNFPEATPRVRNLEADYLTLEISLIWDNRDVFSAKCQLIEGQDILEAPANTIITIEQISACLEEIIEELP